MGGDPQGAAGGPDKALGSSFAPEAFRAATMAARGAFYPQVYALALPPRYEPGGGDPFNELTACAREGDAEGFARTLTYLHEMNHLTTYLSTSFGLAALVAQEHAVMALATSGEPVKAHMPLDEIAAHVALVGNATDFQYYHLQELGNIGPRHYPRDDGDEAEVGACQLFGYPLLPTIFLGHGIYSLADKRRALNGANLLSEDWINRAVDSEREVSTKINAAMLLEALAVTTELHALGAVLGAEWLAENFERFISELDDLYGGLFGICREFGALDSDEILVALPAIVDLALMQDAWIGHGNRPFQPAEINAYKTPASCFFLALDAAAKVGNVTDFLPEGPSDDALLAAVAAYQDAICEALGWPTVAEATDAALRFIARTMPALFVDPDAPLDELKIAPETWSRRGTLDYRVPYSLHFQALRARRAVRGLAGFNVSVAAAGLYFPLIGDNISIIDVDSRTPRADSWFSTSTMAAPALIELLSGRGAMCPYQRGAPYFCPSRLRDDAFCFGPADAGIVHMCPFYLLATKMTPSPGNPQLVEYARPLVENMIHSRR